MGFRMIGEMCRSCRLSFKEDARQHLIEVVLSNHVVSQEFPSFDDQAFAGGYQRELCRETDNST